MFTSHLGSFSVYAAVVLGYAIGDMRILGARLCKPCWMRFSESPVLYS